MRLTLLCAAVLGLARSGAAGEVRFTAGPNARSQGKRAVITFTVSTPTDVAVSVHDAKGTVVRHLAAGVLGANAPAPLKKNSLGQSLAWDFKDDYGGKLPAGPYAVRVGLRLKPAFDRMLGYDPGTIGVLRGLVVSPEGELFVLNLASHLHINFGSPVCQVFDRGWKYKRTIMPYQRTCFPEKVKPFGILDLGEKGRYPFLHHNQLKCIYPFTAQAVQQQMAVTSDGRLILVMRVKGKGAVLVAVDAKDGGAPDTGAFGPAFGKEMTANGCLALAPDGETVYVSRVASQKRWKPLRWKHAVYRARWGDKLITPFIGDPENAAKGDKGLNSPQGIAVDKEGNLYVADHGNNRVAVFSPKGKFLSDLPVEAPYMLGVHRATGAVYVLGKGDPPDHIVKFTGLAARQPVYVRKVPNLLRVLKGKKRLDAYPVFAVDQSGEAPVLWVGSGTPYDRFRLYRFVEKDGKLGEPEEMGRGRGFRSCREIQVDRKREEVYFQQGGDAGEPGRFPRFVKINGADGKILKSLRVRGMGVHFALGHDGYVYIVHGSKRILRYDRNLKPAPYPGTDSNASDPLPGHIYSLHLMGRGLAVRHDGMIFVLHENLPAVHQRYGISAWGPDGKPRKENLVGSLSQGALSLRIDPAGNLYVGDPVKPAGQIVPPDLRGRVDVTKANPYHGKPARHHYAILYGSILKFPPTGGAGVGPKVHGRKGLLAYDAPVGISGDLWQYFGVGPIPAYKGGTYKHYAYGGCGCESMRFDVDGHGRTFAPDAARFRVVVLDSNGNQICCFGRYGNQDSPSAGSGRGAGPRGAVPDPEIPFAWPAAVGVSDRAAYVGDLLSRRIVRVELGYAAEATCDVPQVRR